MTALVKALVLFAFVAPAPHHHRQPSNGVPGCSKTYTVHMAQRATIAVYRQPHVSMRDRKHIGWLERCQRDLRVRPFLDSYVREKRAVWLQAHQPPPILSALARCIITRESGWNPRAVNGQYTGIGQWSQTRWISDGGGRYASLPLYATLAQQEIVLMDEGAAGQADQQGQYDGCSY